MCPTPDHESSQARTSRRSATSSARLTPSRAGRSQAVSVGRGRDAGCPAPPAQIPACAPNALGSCLGYERRSGQWARDAESWVRGATAGRAAASSPSSSGHADRAAAATAASAVQPESGMLAALSRWSEQRGTRSIRVRLPPAIAPALGWADAGVGVGWPSPPAAWPASAPASSAGPAGTSPRVTSR
jgi:hypothetical protein